MRARGDLKEYNIIGRMMPTENQPNPPLYKLRIFAPDHVTAKSRYWYYVTSLKKMKKTQGEIVSLQEVTDEDKSNVKDYGIWLRYDSRSGTHNMYREYRDLSAAGAVTQCYRDMGSRHSARTTSIQIIRVKTVEPEDTKRPHIKQFHNADIKFPLVQRCHIRFSYPTFANKKDVVIPDYVQ